MFTGWSRKIDLLCKIAKNVYSVREGYCISVQFSCNWNKRSLIDRQTNSLLYFYVNNSHLLSLGLSHLFPSNDFFASHSLARSTRFNVTQRRYRYNFIIFINHFVWLALATNSFITEEGKYRIGTFGHFLVVLC